MDIIWYYIIGLLQGKQNVILDGTGYIFSDPENDGNIVIEEAENG